MGASEQPITEISCVQVLSLALQFSLVDGAALSQLGYGELEEETVSRPRPVPSNGKQCPLFIVSKGLTGTNSQVPRSSSISRARGPASLLHLGNLLQWVDITEHVREPASFLTEYITLVFQSWELQYSKSAFSVGHV